MSDDVSWTSFDDGRTSLLFVDLSSLVRYREGVWKVMHTGTNHTCSRFTLYARCVDFGTAVSSVGSVLTTACEGG